MGAIKDLIQYHFATFKWFHTAIGRLAIGCMYFYFSKNSAEKRHATERMETKEIYEEQANTAIPKMQKTNCFCCKKTFVWAPQ